MENCNLIKALAAGETVVGSWLNSASALVAELMAGAGFDFICVDAEHSPVDVPQAAGLFQAIAAGSRRCAPIVRLHGVDYALVKRWLDAGARGVICPLINSRADAELLVQAVKYPPVGRRGVGFCRANRFGADLADAFHSANSEILTGVQIEHIDGVHAIDEILSVRGIDAVFIGPYDLTASMGITAQFDHPEYLAARDRILAACRRHGVHPGIHVVQPSPEEFLARVADGYRFLAYSLDITMLQQACRHGVSTIRAGLERVSAQPPAA